MSGLKKATVTLSENEYHKLHDAQMRLRFLERKVPDMLEEAQEAGNALLWENVSLLRDRQQDYQELVNGFDEQVRDLESVTAESLAAYQEEFLCIPSERSRRPARPYVSGAGRTKPAFSRSVCPGK